MEADAQTVEDAVSVYLERLERLVGQDMPLAEAREIAMRIATTWVDSQADRTYMESQIQAALVKRNAPVIVDLPDPATG